MNKIQGLSRTFQNRKKNPGLSRTFPGCGNPGGRQNSQFLLVLAKHITSSGYTSKYEGKIKFDKKFVAPKRGSLRIETF